MKIEKVSYYYNIYFCKHLSKLVELNKHVLFIHKEYKYVSRMFIHTMCRVFHVGGANGWVTIHNSDIVHNGSLETICSSLKFDSFGEEKL